MSEENSLSDVIHRSLEEALLVKTRMYETLVKGYMEKTGAKIEELELVEEQIDWGFKYYFIRRKVLKPELRVWTVPNFYKNSDYKWDAIVVAESPDEALAMIKDEALYRGFYRGIAIEDLIEIDMSRKNTVIRQTWERGLKNE